MADEPRALIALIGELALLRPKLVVEQGDRYWRIEDLLQQARHDRRMEEHRDELEATLYETSEDARGKISIRNLQSGSIVFSEVGAIEPATDPEP
jgi:hypothetical protein